MITMGMDTVAWSAVTGGRSDNGTWNVWQGVKQKRLHWKKWSWSFQEMKAG